MPVCPACRAEVIPRALRCKACGADARRARDDGDLSIGDIFDLDPEMDRITDILVRLDEIAPGMSARLNSPVRGIHEKRELVELLAEYAALKKKQRG